MMKWLPSLIVCILLSSYSAVSFSQGKKLVQDGIDGFWFPSEQARRILADVEELKIQRDKVSELNGTVLKLESRLELQLERIKNLKVSTDLSEKKAQIATHALNTVNISEDEQNKWYKHPVLWFAAGIVVTVIVEIAAIELLTAIK